MQEVMQLMLTRTNLKAKQETKVTIKVTIQEETRDPQPEADTNQMRRRNCSVKFAKKQHIQTYSFVQNSKPTYHASPMDQRVSPKKYASITKEPSSVFAHTAV